MRLERLHVKLSQTHEFTSKIRRSTTAPVNQAADSYNFSAKISDNINCLLNFSASRNDIFGNDEPLARHDLKSAAQDQLPILFLSENVALAESSANFLSDDDPAHRRRNHRIAFDVCKFRCQVAADLSGDIGVLQDHSALEILPAVQAGTENEVTVQ